MRRKNRLTELLAPAGTYEALLAAVNTGADAVYLGGLAFNARMNAENFTEESLARGIAYAHAHGVKVYVTLNTLVYDKEIPEFLAYAKRLWEMGADAVIVADIGAARLLHRYLPDLPLHGSTQMSVHSADGADALASLGLSRIVLARELSLADLTATTAKTQIETEVFLHGALCVSTSGQCLFSSLVGGRSGNRGECAQPCRLPYNGNRYPLSLSDLCLAAHIPALIESGVASLKIEGRMKSPAYVGGTVKIYRRLLDEGRAATKAEIAELYSLFSRGFTDGYLTGKHTAMTGTRVPNSPTAGETPKEIPVPIFAELTVKRGQPASLTLSDGTRRVTVAGDTPDTARTAALTRAAVERNLCKLGGTFYTLPSENIDLTLDEGLNLSPAAINALRRAAVEGLMAPPPVDAAALPSPAERMKSEALRTAVFYEPAEYDKLSLQAKSFFDKAFLPLARLAECESGEVGVLLPPTVTEQEIPAVRRMLEAARARGVTDALVSGGGQIALVKEYGMTPHGDFRFNIYNRESAAFWKEAGLSTLLLSPELTLPQARDIGGGLIVYGRIPLMLTERCFIKENYGCDACGKARLTDRRGVSFPMIREYPHRNLILNSLPTYMGDEGEELARYGIRHTHFLFTVESAKEIEKTVTAYATGAPLAGQVRRIGKK